MEPISFTDAFLYTLVVLAAYYLVRISMFVIFLIVTTITGIEINRVGKGGKW